MSDYGSENEETKVDYDDDGYQIMVKSMKGRPEMDDYEENFDKNGDDLVSETIMQLMKDTKGILEADKAGSAARFTN